MKDGLTETERGSILEALANGDEEVRRLGVEQLLQLPIAEALPHLSTCLGDSAWRVRKATVARLIACSDETSVQEMLVKSLADGENPGRRNSAFEALIGCGSCATARLVEEMTSPDVDVRKLVIDALAGIGDPDARAPLTRAIRDEDPNVRAAAAEALGVVGGSAEMEHLMDVVSLEDEDVLVRLSSLRSLSRMGASVGVSRLESVLGHSLLRPASFELLGHSSDPTAVDALVKGLSSGSRSSREAAMGGLLRVLGNLDDRAAEDLRSRLREASIANRHLVDMGCEGLSGSDLGRRMILVQFLGLLDDPRVVVPILMAGCDEAIEELADSTLEALGALVPSALEGVWDELEFGPKVRACAILGRAGGARSEDLLAQALASPEGELRCRAALALGEGGFFERAPDLVRQLEATAANDDFESEDEVATMVGAIVRLAEKSEEADAGIEVQLIDVLSSRLGGAPEAVRLAIAQVLARIGREQDEDVLGFLLKDESPAVRRAAVQALGRFDLDHARDALRLSLGDESSLVRMAAANVLGDSDRADAIEDLTRLLADEDPRVVAFAIRSAGRLFHRTGAAPDEAYRLISGVLAAEPTVALAGLEALMEVGGAGAGSIAVAALQRPEPDVVRSAVACLGAHGSEEDLASVSSLVSHADWSVRAEIVQVLADRRHRKSLPALLRRLEVEDDAFVRDAILGAIGRLEG
jgi:HEAT repeat protein